MFDYLSQNKEWIFSGVGIVLVSLLVAIVKFLINHMKFQNGRMKRFCGFYEVFDGRLMDNGVYMKSVLEIRRTFFGTLYVEVNMLKYRYVGKAKIIEQNLYLYIKGNNHSGYLTYIFNEPLGSFSILYGVFAGITSKRKPMCGLVVLNKIAVNELSDIIPGTTQSSGINPNIVNGFNSYKEKVLVAKD